MQASSSITKKCVVAGNAPSLKEIDYKRLPLVYDVFRCNQFYLEDKYYLGKNIKATSFAMQLFFEQIYTMLQLNQRQEYNIESIFIPFNHLIPEHKMQARELELDQLAHIFNDNVFIHSYDSKYRKRVKKFIEFVKLQEIFYYKHPTTAIMLCGIAVAMGYREIYLAGIDFYEGKTYAFDTLKKNITTLMPELQYHIAQEGLEKPKGALTWHSRQADLEALEFLSKHYNASFYSLCPNSPMAKHIPLAPITNNPFLPLEKPKECIQDILIPPPYTRERLKILNNPQDNRRNRMKRNIYFRIFNELIQLPRDIARYIKHHKKDKNG